MVVKKASATEPQVAAVDTPVDVAVKPAKSAKPKADKKPAAKTTKPAKPKADKKPAKPDTPAATPDVVAEPEAAAAPSDDSEGVKGFPMARMMLLIKAIADKKGRPIKLSEDAKKMLSDYVIKSCGKLNDQLRINLKKRKKATLTIDYVEEGFQEVWGDSKVHRDAAKEIVALPKLGAQQASVRRAMELSKDGIRAAPLVVEAFWECVVARLFTQMDSVIAKMGARVTANPSDFE